MTTTIVNDKTRDGSAPYFYRSSEDLLNGLITAFRPERDFLKDHENKTPEATMLINGIKLLSRYTGNGESTWPVNDPLLTEHVEVCKVCGDDPQSAEYVLVWRDVVINYYKHIGRSVAISRPVSFAEVVQALEEIAKAFDEHDLRLKGTQKQFSLIMNANIQRMTREHQERVTKRQHLMEYLEEKYGKHPARPDEKASETEQD